MPFYAEECVFKLCICLCAFGLEKMIRMKASVVSSVYVSLQTLASVEPFII